MIGVFDSGFGGLTVLRELVRAMPQYDFLYLGDNARSPYGSRSFEAIHKYTLEAVEYLFSQGCPLVVLACNTASARALRTIQQQDLPRIAPDRRVLGVIRPCAEEVVAFSRSQHIGIMATSGTVRSMSYPLEIRKLHSQMEISQQACPMLVPLVEYGEHTSPGALYFVKQYVDALLSQDPRMDLVVMACTHYPLLADLIQSSLPNGVALFDPASAVAKRLVDYLQRHPEMDARLSKSGRIQFLTTDSPDFFENIAEMFWGSPIKARQAYW